MSIFAYAIIPPPLAVVISATLAVVDTPVKPIVISVGLIDPTLNELVDTPVKPTAISVGLIDPTLAVVYTPVISIRALLVRSIPSAFKEKVLLTPDKSAIVLGVTTGVPRLEVTAKLVNP